MDGHTRIFILTLSGGVISLVLSIWFALTLFGNYAFSLIPFSFLSFATVALIQKHQYRPAAFFALLSGLATFPFGGFLTVWGGWTAYRYHPVHQAKVLKEAGVRPELVAWVRKRLDRGYMEDYIRHVLAINGYKQEIIDAAFKKLISG